MELNLKQLASYTDSLVEPEIAVELIAWSILLVPRIT